MSIVKEFKEFAIKGNAIDLAVGLVIGNAFGKIVTSLVQDIIMPLIGTLIGNFDLSKLNIELTPAQYENGQLVSPPVGINLGIFLSSILDFILIALSIFLVIKLINRTRENPPSLKPTVN